MVVVTIGAVFPGQKKKLAEGNGHGMAFGLRGGEEDGMDKLDEGNPGRGH